MPMLRSKVDLAESTDETLLQEMYGLGSKTISVLQSAGYNLGKRATLRDYETATGSWEQLRRTLQDKNIEAGYSETKLKQLWGHIQRRKTYTGLPHTDVTDPQSNFLIAPEGEAPKTDPQQESDVKETPEIHALTRTPIAEKAVATGFVSSSVDLSVIPDVTLNLSIPDKEIAAPTEPSEQSEVPIVPSIAVGGGVGVGVQAARNVEAETTEEKLESYNINPDAQQQKANFRGDIGGDGKGSMLDIHEGDLRQQQQQSKVFKSVPMDVSVDDNTQPPEVEQDDTENLVTGSQHPFKQQSLFRNHDEKALFSRRVQQAHADLFASSLASRAARLVQQTDPSFTIYNPYTQGVDSVAMPVRRSMNFLSKAEPLQPSYQYFGPQPLMNINNPSAEEREFILGKFQ
jgi:hypothetical protein